MRSDILKADRALQASELHPSLRSGQNKLPPGLDGSPPRFADLTKDTVKE
jgi:hypothetical protein